MLALIAVATACASAGEAASGGSASRGYGYMIPGPGIAPLAAAAPTDTLAELPPGAAMQRAVSAAISREAARLNLDDRCTRTFGGPEIYLSLLHRNCDSAFGADADPVLIAGFAADGRLRGRAAWRGAGTVTLLVPSRRF